MNLYVIAVLVLKILANFKSVHCGAAAYRLLEEYADDLDSGNMIEIGSDRGEGSTRWLAEFAARGGRDFFTVDFSPEGFNNALRSCGACAFQGMGEDFLAGTLFLGLGAVSRFEPLHWSP
jgi:hypothetical protein